MFKLYDKVYHRELNLNGIFITYEWLNKDVCFVDFGVDGNNDFKKVNVSEIELV